MPGTKQDTQGTTDFGRQLQAPQYDLVVQRRPGQNGSTVSGTKTLLHCPQTILLRPGMHQ